MAYNLSKTLTVVRHTNTLEDSEIQKCNATHTNNAHHLPNKGQSHSALEGITTNMLLRAKGSYMGLAVVPLDTALLPQTVYSNQILFDRGSDPQIPPSREDQGLLSNTVLLGTTQVSLPNGILFRPMALAACKSVTDIQTDRQVDHAMVTSQLLQQAALQLSAMPHKQALVNRISVQLILMIFTLLPKY